MDDQGLNPAALVGLGIFFGLILVAGARLLWCAVVGERKEGRRG